MRGYGRRELCHHEERGKQSQRPGSRPVAGGPGFSGSEHDANENPAGAVLSTPR